jgi:hypothetical protein
VTVRLAKAICPPADVGKVDTSLRYTDVLFGFVIKELFVRLKNWAEIDSAIQWHLILGTALVLGSWIGYRRSINRAQYEVKFFNLPFFKFLVDQLMLILYFRLAVLTEADPTPPISARPDLAAQSVELVTYVFVLYLVWDFLGLWMAKAKTGQAWKYPKVSGEGKDAKAIPDNPADPNWRGTIITAVALAVLMMVSLVANISAFGQDALMILTTMILIFYRLAKEIRSSWLT